MATTESRPSAAEHGSQEVMSPPAVVVCRQEEAHGGPRKPTSPRIGQVMHHDLEQGGSEDGRSSAKGVRMGWDCVSVPRRVVEKQKKQARGLPVLKEGVYGTSWVLGASIPRRFYGAVLTLALLCILAVFIVFTNFTMHPETSFGDPLNFGWPGYYWPNASKIDTSCGMDGALCNAQLQTGWIYARCLRYGWTESKNIPRAVVGTGLYHPAGFLCASAIHAGVITNDAGGCFKYRFVGPQQRFVGSEQNGAVSSSFGWFPQAMEFAEVEGGGQCNMVRPGEVVFWAVATFLLFVLVRPPAYIGYYFLILSGFLYLIGGEIFKASSVVQLINGYGSNLISLLALSILLWIAAGPTTFPELSKYPLDGFIFYFLPFLAAIHLDFITLVGINLEFGPGMFSTPGLIAGFCLFFVIGIPVAVLQLRLWYRSSVHFFEWLGFAVFVILAVAIYWVIFNDSVSLHIHHYIAGGVGFLLFQGQPKRRYSILFQAVALGLFVNGVTLWGPASLFDPVSPASQPGTTYVWTGVNITEDSVSMQWALSSLVDELCSNSTTNLTSSEATSAPPSVRGMFSPASLQAHASGEYYRRLAETASAPMTVSMNGLLIAQGYLQSTDGIFSTAREGLLASTFYQFAAGNGDTTTPYLYINTSTPHMYYDPTDPTYSEDICARVKALGPPT